MKNFDKVEKTLFVPMLGRIYCSQHLPHILMDKKAVELGQHLSEDDLKQEKNTQYTLIASAVRSTNIDRYIRDFMQRHADGVIVQLGCGLETTYYRNDDGHHPWIEVDLPEVIAYRKQLLGETERDHCMAADACGEEWIQEVRKQYPTAPLLVTASGLFYYIPGERVLGMMKSMKQYGPVEMVFDAVNSAGMKQMPRLMKQVGHAEATMYFYVDDVKELADKVDATYAADEKYYKYTSKKGLKWMTKMSMRVADWLMMVKMVHLKW